MWGPSQIYEYCPTEFTRHAQRQCCHHRHFVNDSHNIIMHTEQKVWSNCSLSQQNYVNYPTCTEYFVITWLFSAHVLLWGPIFVGAPVRPNMLNMPKSASVNHINEHSCQIMCSKCPPYTHDLRWSRQH